MPKGDRIVQLRFPTGGVDRRLGFQSQGPFTTPHAINVRPDSSLARRERGGSRPGMSLCFRETLGSGNPIRMLAPLDVVEHNGRAFWQDTFEGDTLGAVWTEASWLTESPTIASRTARARYGTAATGVVRSAFSPTIAAATAYVVEMFIVPHNGRHSGTYSLFLRMNDSSPNASTGGVQARLTLSGTTGTFSGSLLVDGATTYNFSGGTDSFPAAGWFTVRVVGNSISAYWRGNTLISGQAVAAAAGQRVGFGINATVAGGTCIVDRFRVQYYRTGETQNVSRRFLMASSNGSLYKETELGSMAAISSSLTLASTTALQATQRLQKLYIADYGDWKVSGTATGSGSGTTFDDSGVADWSAYSISTNDDVVSIYDSSDADLLLEGVYPISAVAAGSLTLTTSCGGPGTCSYLVTRGPKVYDHSAGTLSLWTATTGKGAVPVGCPLICLYRDRIVMAGGADGPHIWYMSRQGDPLDWDYTAEDVGRAVAASNSNAGIIGEPITALIPHADQCIIFGCLSSMWIMRGDPAFGGQIDNLSRNVGVVSGRAWCYVPGSSGDQGLIVFMSQDGLYMIPAGCNATSPVSLSREKLPDELLNLDPESYEITLAYDVPDRVIHINVSSHTSGTAIHWLFDWESKGFFQVELPVSIDPMSSMEYTSSCSEDSTAIFGCRDGIIRRYHRYHYKDDGNNEIESSVDFGPLMLGEMQGWGQGVLAELVAELGADSASVDVAVRAGNSPEAAYNATAQWDSTFTETGLNYVKHPRVGGGAGFVRLSNSTTRPWSMEALRIRIQQMGRNTR